MVNQKQADLGIPNRFNLTPSRFRIVAPFVGFLVVANFLLAVGLAWDDGSYASLFENSPDRIGAIAFIGEEFP
jgi:hypothetical protein